jgi:hypothetical protein
LGFGERDTDRFVDVLAEPVGEALPVMQQPAGGGAVEDLAAAGDHDARG